MSNTNSYVRRLELLNKQIQPISMKIKFEWLRKLGILMFQSRNVNCLSIKMDKGSLQEIWMKLHRWNTKLYIMNLMTGRLVWTHTRKGTIKCDTCESSQSYRIYGFILIVMIVENSFCMKKIFLAYKQERYTWAQLWRYENK